jgi:[ribosomal protein S5]-alanine N-acetyltransferase
MAFVSNKIELTGLTTGDEEDIVTWMQDKEISEGTSRIPFPYNIIHARQWIEDNLVYEQEQQRRRNYAIRDETGRMIGCIGLHFNYGTDADKSEFGYWLGKPYRNRGIMTEAIQKMAVLAKEQYGLKSLEAHVFDFNIASQKALLKAGFTPLAFVPSHYEKDGNKIDAIKFVLQL